MPQIMAYFSRHTNNNIIPQLFKQWCDNVEQIATARLQDFILADDPDAKQTVVNFHPDLTYIIRETKYLDKLGYTIPETALNITLQVS